MFYVYGMVLADDRSKRRTNFCVEKFELTFYSVFFGNFQLLYCLKQEEPKRNMRAKHEFKACFKT